MAETRDEQSACSYWRPCCCQRAADGHCWACGRPRSEHAGVPPTEMREGGSDG